MAAVDKEIINEEQALKEIIDKARADAFAERKMFLDAVSEKVSFGSKAVDMLITALENSDKEKLSEALALIDQKTDIRSREFIIIAKKVLQELNKIADLEKSNLKNQTEYILLPTVHTSDVEQNKVEQKLASDFSGDLLVADGTDSTTNGEYFSALGITLVFVSRFLLFFFRNARGRVRPKPTHSFFSSRRDSSSPRDRSGSSEKEANENSPRDQSRDHVGKASSGQGQGQHIVPR